jgi:hypothetical protein
MLLLKRVECIKRSSYYLTKSNGAFNKGKTGASQQFSNRELTSIPITGSRSINQLPSTTLMLAVGFFGGQDS